MRREQTFQAMNPREARGPNLIRDLRYSFAKRGGSFRSQTEQHALCGNISLHFDFCRAYRAKVVTPYRRNTVLKNTALFLATYLGVIYLETR